MHLHFVCLLGILLGGPVTGNTGATTIPWKKDQTGSDSLSIYQSLNLSADKTRTETGLLNLENGGHSFITRLWLLKEAKKTLDLQYFSFARNLTGLIASEYLIKAAERGVKIRLLIDELS